MRRNALQRGYGHSMQSRLLMMLIACAMAVAFALYPFNAGEPYGSCYAACAVLLFIGLTCCYDVSNIRTAPMSPFYIVSVVYLFMFAICPMRDIIVGKTLWFGYSLFQYGLNATIIAIVGYIAFYLVYRNAFKRVQDEQLAFDMQFDVDAPKGLVSFIVVM